jgi:predicted nuclease of restriction endonuclease-like (RecB) superfamily
MAESDLEGALVDHLQQFLFELGRDFCFVARQFRISRGESPSLHRSVFHGRLRWVVAIDL